MKVFIADDSSEIRKRIIAMLSDLAESIEMIGEAENVQDAINSIHEFDPDVVILDIRMPGGSGIDVLKKIKKKNEVPVIIILTNYPYSQYRKKCMEAGADFFFDKSGDFEEIVKVVSDISGGRIL
ncbi:MAG: response regulator transcription factor [Thermodesulfovibrionales bacterium]